MSTVYCRECGEAIADTEKICPKCGADQLPATQTPLAAFDLQQWSGFWRRVAAQIIDAFIVWIPVSIAIFIAAAVLAAVKAKPGEIFAIVTLLELLIIGLYQAMLNSSNASATWGRRAVGIAVVDAENGETLAFGRAFLRCILSLVTGLLILPQLVQLFTAKRQSVADMLTGSVVVRKESKSSTGLIIVLLVVVLAVPVMGILAAIAVPAYQDYTVRARVTQGLMVASAAKIAVADNAFQGASDLGAGFQAPPSRSIQSIAVDQNGVITVTMSQIAKSVVFSLRPMSSAGPLVAGQKASGNITWRCAVSDARNDRYVPTECRIYSIEP